jgi:hypothetical protein
MRMRSCIRDLGLDAQRGRAVRRDALASAIALCQAGSDQDKLRGIGEGKSGKRGDFCGLEPHFWPEIISLREDRYAEGRPVRDGKWSESVAVGNMEFVEQTRERLGIRASGRNVMEAGDSFEPRGSGAAYAADLADRRAGLRNEKTYFGNGYSEKSVG